MTLAKISLRENEIFLHLMEYNSLKNNDGYEKIMRLINKILEVTYD